MLTRTAAGGRDGTRVARPGHRDRVRPRDLAVARAAPRRRGRRAVAADGELRGGEPVRAHAEHGAHQYRERRVEVRCAGARFRVRRRLTGGAQDAGGERGAVRAGGAGARACAPVAATRLRDGAQEAGVTLRGCTAARLDMCV